MRKLPFHLARLGTSSSSPTSRHCNRYAFAAAVPLLQAASVQTDEELQERWAALLECSVASPDDVLPSFGLTLSQLTAEEARYLQRLNEYRLTGLNRMAIMSVNQITVICDPKRERRTPDVGFAIGDMVRLGLIERVQHVGNPLDPVPEEARNSDIRFSTGYRMSEFGVRFVGAVTPQSKPRTR